MGVYANKGLQFHMSNLRCNARSLLQARSSFVHPYIAHNVRQVCEPQQEPSENIEFTFMRVQQLQSSIDAGEFRAGLHIGTVFMGLQKLGLL